MKNKHVRLIAFLIFFQLVACKKDQKQVITAPTPWEADGLGTHLTASKSLNKDYSYYFDQFDGSQYQGINCGPTVTTMAIKWADSTFSKLPVDARNTIPASGGWWYTSDINNYLNMNGINHVILSFTPSTADAVIETSIDNNNEVILCLDMYYALYNPDPTQHTNKFYVTTAPNWGHFLLVKGYKQVDGKLYYEIYDPYTDHETYADNTPKGKDRYYLNSTITDATNVWWKYAIVVAPKNQQVVTSNKLQINSIQTIPVARGQ